MEIVMSEAASPQARLVALGLALPPAPKPAGVYKPCLVVGNQVLVSGHGPLREDGTMITGRVGVDLDTAAGKAAARQVGLAILSTLVAGLGSLDRVARVVKVLGLVNAPPEFTEQPLVMNGCSELFAEIWGPDRGVGVRSALGAGSLPGNIAVEIEAAFELA
jgi:enamine deaminase RidA (YjgF/YER057c/UK114 family)